MGEKDQWTQPDEINIIHGEQVEIPINKEGATDSLSQFQLSLHKFGDQNILENLTKAIKIEQSNLGTYNQIVLTDLEVGCYKLKLNMTASQQKLITINVRQGSYWEGSFILERNCLREYTAPS